jgi:hypothetical protein
VTFGARAGTIVPVWWVGGGALPIATFAVVDWYPTIRGCVGLKKEGPGRRGVLTLENEMLLVAVR